MNEENDGLICGDAKNYSHESFNIYIKDQTYFINGILDTWDGRIQTFFTKDTYISYEPKKNLKEVIELIRAEGEIQKEKRKVHTISLISNHQHPEFGDPKGLGENLDKEELWELKDALEDLISF